MILGWRERDLSVLFVSEGVVVKELCENVMVLRRVSNREMVVM